MLKPVAAASALILILFIIWYVEVGNLNDGNVAGFYTWRSGSSASSLLLLKDHSFVQHVTTLGFDRDAHGVWRLFPAQSQNRIELSSEFLQLPSETKNVDGTAYGEIENVFGLISISLKPSPSAPVFRRKLFR